MKIGPQEGFLWLKPCQKWPSRSFVMTTVTSQWPTFRNKWPKILLKYTKEQPHCILNVKNWATRSRDMAKYVFHWGKKNLVIGSKGLTSIWRVTAVAWMVVGTKTFRIQHVFNGQLAPGPQPNIQPCFANLPYSLTSAANRFHLRIHGRHGDGVWPPLLQPDFFNFKFKF